MATVNLGRIKPVWKGAWSSSTQYIADDIVQYNNSAWTCLATNTNSAPSTGNSNWDLMALGTDIPSQSGNSGKVLKTDGSSLSWDNGSAVLQFAQGYYDGQATASSGTTYVQSPLQVTITSKASGSAYLIESHCWFGYGNHDVFAGVHFGLNGTIITPISASTNGGHRVFSLSGDASYAGQGTVDDWGCFQANPKYLYIPESSIAAGSSLTFSMFFNVSGSANTSIYMNQTQQGTSSDARNARPRSTITVTEIATSAV